MHAKRVDSNMKRFIVFLCLLGIMLTLCCCNNTKEKEAPSNNSLAYTIKEEDGNYYIQFDENASYSASANSTQIGKHTPKFNSVSELKTTIETGNFSQEDLAYLQKRSKNGITALGHPDNLYDVTLPSGLDATGVYWEVDGYLVDINWGRNEYEHGSVTIELDETAYTQAFEQFCNYKSAADIIISETTLSDRNASELIYTNVSGKYRLLNYQLTNKNKIIYIQELYCLETYVPDSFHWTISESVPFIVKTFCDEGPVQWYTHFTGFEERPTVQWLSSIGTKKVTD